MTAQQRRINRVYTPLALAVMAALALVAARLEVIL